MSAQKDKTSLVIGLCDDDIHIYHTVSSLLASYAENNNIECHIVYYNSAKKLLEAKDELDCLLLDIEMPELDGIEAAFKLRDRGINYKIIMLTARDDRYREAFKIGAFRFIPKPIEERELYKAIDDVREHLVGLTKVTVFRDGVAYEIMQRDIIYVEADRSATLIFTKNFEFRSEKSLSEWMKLLDERMFFQCHKSYIVNMGKVDEIGKDTISLVTGEKVKVARRIKSSFLQAFMTYDTSRR
ncbi:MAG: LytR/AlgR family response regulator transcription factor [Lachnospiraceae bacterium]